MKPTNLQTYKPTFSNIIIKMRSISILFIFSFFAVSSLFSQATCGDLILGNQPIIECECDTCVDYIPSNYQWGDRFGNQYCNIEIVSTVFNVNNSTNTTYSAPINPYSSPDCTGGIFDLYFVDIQENFTTGFNHSNGATYQAHRDLICQVFTDVSAMLNANGIENVKIKIESENNASSSTLASAGTYYDLNASTGILYGETWKAINSINDPNQWDGQMVYNFNYMNQTYTGTAPSGINNLQYDLYTITLHEILHILGMASLIDDNTGVSKYPGYYTKYDQFLKGTGSNIVSSGNFIGFSSDLVSTCSHLEFEGNYVTSPNLGPIYSPNSWNGSSISHFDNGCTTNNFIMNPTISLNSIIFITDIEVKALCDLGYSITNTYGNTPYNTSPNERGHAITSCGVTLVAVDDDINCNSNSQFSIEFCTGNQLIINSNDLLCNDIWSSSLSGVYVSNIFDPLTGLNLTQTGANFIFTPTNMGMYDLIYTLEDANGLISNEAVITINVYPCVNSLFNTCSYTNTCNQICNPSLDFTCTNQTSYPSSHLQIISSSGASCDELALAVDGWIPLCNTPDLIISSTYVHLPYDLNNTTFRGAQLNSSNQNYPESVGTSVNILHGKNYLLSYHNPSIVFGSSVFSNNGVDVYLDNVSNPSFNFPFLGSVGGGVLGSPPNLNSSFQLISDAQAGTSSWTRSIHKFSIINNNDYDLLIFIPRFSTSYVATFGLDLIELIEDNLNSNYISTNEVGSYCGETIIIGEPLCELVNMRYNWYDVTNGIPIQLTQGLINLGIDPNINIPNGSNGSELQVNIYSDKTYRLEREFYETNSVPIVTNNAVNDYLDININLELDINISKTEISGNTYAGGQVTYQITVNNQSSSNLTNFDIVDALSVGNFVVSSLNTSNLPAGLVTYQGNTGNDLTFRIVSLNMGSSITFEYSIDLVSTLSIGNVVENCVSYTFGTCFEEYCNQVIIINVPLNINLVNITNPLCYGGTGFIDVVVSNGTPPYTYLWNNSSNSPTEDLVDVAGTYTLTVTDAIGDIVTATYTLLNAPFISVSSINTQNPLCFNGNSGSISINASGGTGVLTYSIDGGATFQSSNIFNGLSAGTYSIIIKDANNCEITYSKTLTDPPEITFTVSTTDESCYAQEDGKITISNVSSNAVLPVSYSIDNGVTTQSSPIFTNLTPGSYNVTVIDANGCMATVNNVIINAFQLLAGTIVIGSSSNPSQIIPLSSLLNNTLPPNGIIGLNIHINCILLVDVSNYSFQYSNFTFGPGAGIDIASYNLPNYSLTVLACNFNSICETMWRGFKLIPETSIAMKASQINDAHFGIEAQSGSYLNLRDVEFTNNFIGLFLPPWQYNIQWNTNIGDLQMNNCTFKSEFPGTIHPYQGQSGYSNMRMPAQPLYHHQSFAGIWAVNNNVFNLVPTDANHFENLTYGIGVHNLYPTPHSTFTNIVNNEFNGINNNASSLGMPAYQGYRHSGIYSFTTIGSLSSLQTENCTILNSSRGISSLKNNLSIKPPYLFDNVDIGIIHNIGNNCYSQISNATINANVHGIIAINNSSIQSLHYGYNTISLGNNLNFSRGILLLSPSTASNNKRVNNNLINVIRAEAGIQLIGSDNVEVIDNTINLNPIQSVGAHTRFGIRDQGGNNNVIAKNDINFALSTISINIGNNEPVAIDAAGSTSETIECNQTNGTFTGIRISGLSDNLILRGNTIENHRTGLRYASVTGANLIQANAGNLWTGSLYGSTANQQGGAYNNAGVNNPFAINLQEYRVNPIGNPNLMPPNHFPNLFNLQWFPTNTGTAFDCSNSVYLLPTPNPPNVSYLNETAEGNIPVEKYETEINKQEQRILYKTMKVDLNLHNLSSKIDSFYTASENNELKEMYDAKELTNEIKLQATGNKLIKDSIQDSLTVFINQLIYLDSLRNFELSLLTIDTNSIDSIIDTVYLNQRKVLLELIDQKSLDIKSEEAHISQTEVLKADESINKYQTIVNQETIDFNIKYTEALRMQLAYKNHTLNQTDISQLFQIADQCPLAGGRGVYAARSIVMQEIDTFWIDYDRCLDEGYDIRKTDLNDDSFVIPAQAGISEISIYPNPTNGKIFIKLNKEYSQLTIELIGILGNKVFEKDITTKDKIIELKLKDIVPGVYTISLYNNKKEIHNEKLIID